MLGGRALNIFQINKQLDELTNLLMSVDEVLEELSVLKKGINEGNSDDCKKMLFLLAPTGSLQEISISSGWGDEFLVIAESLEKELEAT